ncbi:MAG: PA14 domain-containing protein [Bacteriovoracia bacterium]
MPTLISGSRVVLGLFFTFTGLTASGCQARLEPRLTRAPALARLDTAAPGVIDESRASAQTAPTQGLLGKYFDNADLTSLKFSRIDAAVNFDWGAGSPDASMDADTYSIRWKGSVEAPFSAPFTFYTWSDDGVRLWINDQLVIDNWTGHSATENSGVVYLVGGERYTVRLEYYENTGNSVIGLKWSAPGLAKQIIPNSALFAPGSTANGIGLEGKYFNNVDLTELMFRRLDPRVYFPWGTSAPDPTMGANTFSVEWNGFVVPLHSENYTFYTYTDDGARLWIDGQLIINDWQNHSAANRASAPIALEAGVRYPLRMRYYDQSGEAVAKLKWESASQAMQVIQTSQLFPPELSPVLAPNIGYESSIVATQGSPLGAVIPINTGGPISGCSVTPALPAGLSLAATTCGVSGTPTASSPLAQYTVTATSPLGSTQAIVQIGVNSGSNPPPPPPPPAAAPEVTVTLNGVNITDGQSAAIDFGSVAQNASGPTRVFQVKNDGNATLTLGTVNVPAGYALTEALSTSLAPGASDTFSVRLNTGAAGSFSGSVSFTNNDANESPFNFSVTGMVTSTPPPPPPPSGNAPIGCSIQAPYGLSGYAPFTAHVHVISAGCNLRAGDYTSARIEWDFGTPSGNPYQLVGFNGSYTYDTPGTYTLTLRVANETGAMSTYTALVNVMADNRSAIYVSAAGNDNNPGTQAAPIASLTKVGQLLSAGPNNRAVYFRRGDTFTCGGTCLSLTGQNVLVGAYGSGAKPVIATNQTTNWGRIINLSGSQIVVQDLKIRTTKSGGTCGDNSAANDSCPAAFEFSGTNLTARRNDADNLGSFLKVNGSANAVLLRGNSAPVIGGYFVWAAGGNDHVYTENTVLGSRDQHNFRMYHNRVLLHGNYMSTDGSSEKPCIDFAGTNYGYARMNTLLGRVRIGYWDGSGSNPSGRNSVFEGNHITWSSPEGAIFAYPGADNTYLRNNVIIANGGVGIKFMLVDDGSGTWVWSDHSSSNVRIVHNTIVDSSTSDRQAIVLRRVTPDPVLVANNVVVRPNSHQIENVFLEEISSLPAHYAFINNRYRTPANANCVIRSGAACYSLTSWEGFGFTSGENVHGYSASSFSADFTPPNDPIFLNAPVIPGIFDDYYGRLRGSARTAGALERNPL